MIAIWSTVLNLAPSVASATLNALFLLVTTVFLSSFLAVWLTVADIAAPKALRLFIRLYSWLAQTTPPLILLFLAFYGSTAFGWFISPMTAAVIAFVLFATAYYFEIFRASYNGVPQDQFEAAYALGIPPLSFAIKVIIPQVVRIAAAPFIGRTTVLFKETSLASAISVSEIMSTTSAFIYSGENPLLMVAVAGAIYAIINTFLITIEKRCTRRMAIA
ncbi:ABC transporter permease subunit [Rhizobium sp. CG4]|jgi:His/Glu/Gln/Arg/opine family amino acid ABC transporter permease subunit|uniref:ABC transporter permease subunit n=1 Tax=Rhizobium sp. CG4 TaxID=2726075 RepID=UPI002034124D|nr:ABC transporter permease subunit [Rhizobium sp. CG4]MCM2456457.1 ABC transporter permease subunit [Rhizobium sp. CG4]